jgi:hypothetical protein
MNKALDLVAGILNEICQDNYSPGQVREIAEFLLSKMDDAGFVIVPHEATDYIVDSVDKTRIPRSREAVADAYRTMVYKAMCELDTEYDMKRHARNHKKANERMFGHIRDWPNARLLD